MPFFRKFLGRALRASQTRSEDRLRALVQSRDNVAASRLARGPRRRRRNKFGLCAKKWSRRVHNSSRSCTSRVKHGIALLLCRTVIDRTKQRNFAINDSTSSGLGVELKATSQTNLEKVSRSSGMSGAGLKDPLDIRLRIFG